MKAGSVLEAGLAAVGTATLVAGSIIGTKKAVKKAKEKKEAKKASEDDSSSTEDEISVV